MLTKIGTSATILFFYGRSCGRRGG